MGDFTAVHPFGRKRASGHCATGGGGALVGEVGEDAQVGSAACQFGQQGGEVFDGRVDRVGSHRVAAIVVQVDDEHGADGGVGERPGDYVSRPAAAPHNVLANAVGRIHEQLFVGFDDLHGRFHIGHIEQLDLANHHGLAGLGVEAAAVANHFGGVGDGRQYAGFFDGHGDEVGAAVNQKIGGDAEGKGMGADAVFYHVAGLLCGEATSQQNLLLGGGEASPFGDGVDAFGRGEFVEAGEAGGFGHTGLLVTGYWITGLLD